MKQLWAPWRFEYLANANDSDQECIFCTIQKESYDKKNLIVFHSKYSFVILNKFPYNTGHLMVVPYKHESDLTLFSDEILLDIQHTLQKSIIAVRNSMHPHGMNIGINIGRTAGAGIDQHLHYHLVPRWNGDTNFMPILTDTKVVSESLENSWKKLKQQFKKL